MSHYKIEFSFGVGKDRHQNEISHDKRLAAMAGIKREASERFGSYTLVATYGGWTSPVGGLVEEPGYTLSIVRPGSAEHNAYKDEDFAAFICTALEQEAVAVTITNVFFHLNNFI